MNALQRPASNPRRQAPGPHRIAAEGMGAIIAVGAVAAIVILILSLIYTSSPSPPRGMGVIGQATVASTT
jgi:hypothetical protein